MTDETSTWLRYASLRLAADSLCLFNFLPATSDEAAYLAPPDSDSGKHTITEEWMHDRAALLDALVHAGVMSDDSLIDKLTVERGPIFKGGKVRVFISEVGK